MVNFIYQAGSQTNLVSVGRITCCRCIYNRSLGKLSFQRIFDRCRWISRTCYSHSLIYIASSGKRIPDGAAYTGGRAAERFDLRRMIVRFILKQKQPILLSAVHVRFDFHRAGVDFLGTIQTIQLSPCTQSAGTDSCNIHQSDRFVSSGLPPKLQIRLVSLFHIFILNIRLVNLRRKCGMAAVIRPVSIQNPQFRHRGASSFTAEIIPAADQIVPIHSQSILTNPLVQSVSFQIKKSFQNGYIRRNLACHFQSLRFFQRSFPAFYRIDHIVFDCCDFLDRQISVQQIDLRRRYVRTLFLRNDLDALCCRIRSLIKLTRKIFHRKNSIIPRRDLIPDFIQRRFGKHVSLAGFKQTVIDIFYIVSVQQAQIR